MIVFALGLGLALAEPTCGFAGTAHGPCLCSVPSPLLNTQRFRPWQWSGLGTNKTAPFLPAGLASVDAAIGSWNALPQSRAVLHRGNVYVETDPAKKLPPHNQSDGFNTIVRISQPAHWPFPVLPVVARTTAYVSGSCGSNLYYETDIWLKHWLVSSTMTADDYNAVVFPGVPASVPLPEQPIWLHEFGHVLTFGHSSSEAFPQTMQSLQLHGAYGDEDSGAPSLHITGPEVELMALLYPDQSPPAVVSDFALLPYYFDNAGSDSSFETWNTAFGSAFGTVWSYNLGDSFTYGLAGADDGPAPLWLQVTGAMPSTSVVWFLTDAPPLATLDCDDAYLAHLSDGSYQERLLGTYSVPAGTDEMIEVGSSPSTSPFQVSLSLTCGDYYLCAGVDPSDAQTEWLETNNWVRSERIFTVGCPQ